LPPHLSLTTQPDHFSSLLLYHLDWIGLAYPGTRDRECSTQYHTTIYDSVQTPSPPSKSHRSRQPSAVARHLVLPIALLPASCFLPSVTCSSTSVSPHALHFPLLKPPPWKPRHYSITYSRTNMQDTPDPESFSAALGSPSSHEALSCLSPIGSSHQTLKLPLLLLLPFIPKRGDIVWMSLL
jgi:hypothetical protein